MVRDNLINNCVLHSLLPNMSVFKVFKIILIVLKLGKIILQVDVVFKSKIISLVRGILNKM